MSNYLENRLVDHVFRATSFTAPAGMHVALFTAAPTDAGGGTEVTGGAYARSSYTPSLTNWEATQQGGATAVSSGTTGTIRNLGVISFPAPTANWGTITSFAIFDAASAGNMLIWGSLTTNKTVNSGDAAPSFQANALSFTIDD